MWITWLAENEVVFACVVSTLSYKLCLSGYPSIQCHSFDHEGDGWVGSLMKLSRWWNGQMCVFFEGAVFALVPLVLYSLFHCSERAFVWLRLVTHPAWPDCCQFVRVLRHPKGWKYDIILVVFHVACECVCVCMNVLVCVGGRTCLSAWACMSVWVCLYECVWVCVGYPWCVGGWNAHYIYTTILCLLWLQNGKRIA